MADTLKTRFYSYQMAGAPNPTSGVGSRIALFDACFITGFGSASVDALTVAGGVATLTISAGNPFLKWSVIRIAGATPAELNGDWRVTSNTGSDITFNCPAIADTTATGTITAMVAPVGGWVKTEIGTNQAVYHPTAIFGGRGYIHIDDTYSTTAAKIYCYELFDGVTLTNMIGGLGYIENKLNEWHIFADPVFYYWMNTPSTSTSYLRNLVYFGELVDHSVIDDCPVIYSYAASSSYPSYAILTNTTTAYIRMLRTCDGAVLGPQGGLASASYYSRSKIGDLGDYWPSRITGSYDFMRPVWFADNYYETRGALPGLFSSHTDGYLTMGGSAVNAKGTALFFALDPDTDRAYPILVVAATHYTDACSSSTSLIPIAIEDWR